MLAATVDVSDCIRMIRAEYREMPGLSLTTQQCGRLWHLDAETCEKVLDRLVDDHFLRRTDRDMYVKDGGG
jgi:hypothetical protein